MSNKVYKILVDKMGESPSEDYIGTPGELFYDPEQSSLRKSNGQTVGGVSFGGSGGGGGSVGNFRTLDPNSDGVEDLGEGGYVYTITPDDAGSTIVTKDITTIFIPPMNEVQFGLGSYITFIADDPLYLVRKTDEDGDYGYRIYLAGGDGGDSDYSISDRGIASIVLYRDGRWMLSGPNIEEIGSP